MPEIYEPDAAIIEESVATALARLTKTSQSTLDFMFGAQKALLDEMVFAGNEMFDRIRTEMHLISEFISKTAGSHSVMDLKTMGMECAQHQIDFIRRDCERVFKHGDRVIEATTNLLNNRADRSAADGC